MDCEYAEKNVILCPVGIVAKKFRAQPIVCPKTMKVTALELLRRERLNYTDAEAMLNIDIDALENASILARHYREEFRIHCNVELTSIMDGRWWWAMAGVMWPSIVVEIVERNHMFSSESVMHRTKIIADGIRNRGGVLALDDVTGTNVEMMAIRTLKPEILKVESTDCIAALREITGSKVVVERIETEQEARNAALQGANELQGYWCDVQTTDVVHHSLTPPGVMALAAQREERMVA